MRKPQQEIGGEIGVLGAPNPYGDDAIWDNNKRSWASLKSVTVNTSTKLPESLLGASIHIGIHRF